MTLYVAHFGEQMATFKDRKTALQVIRVLKVLRPEVRCRLKRVTLPELPGVTP